jgi:hypothetical protein
LQRVFSGDSSISSLRYCRSPVSSPFSFAGQVQILFSDGQLLGPLSWLQF